MTTRDLVDPQLVACMEDSLKRSGADFMATNSPAERRVSFAAMIAERSPPEPPFPQVERRASQLPSREQGRTIPVCVFTPAGVETRHAMLYIHGGGFTLGSVAMEDGPAAALADQLGVVVVSLDYRLAPEHPYPDAINDCYDTLAWLAANPEIPSERIVLYGASAGGGLCAALALMARDLGSPAVAGQVLSYPMLDDRSATPSCIANDGLGLWDRATNEACWRQLLGPVADDGGVPAYAAAARASSLAGLPPTFIMVGALDILLDEAIDFARRLLGDGVAAELHVVPGAVHSFDLMGASARVSQRAIACRLAALRDMLGEWR